MFLKRCDGGHRDHASRLVTEAQQEPAGADVKEMSKMLMQSEALIDIAQSIPHTSARRGAR
jgi:hypothetical protein